MPQQQDQNTNHTSPFRANTGQSEQPQQPELSRVSEGRGYACIWPRRQPGEWRPVSSVRFGLGPRNSTAGPDASGLAEPGRYFGAAAPGSTSPINRYEPVPSPFEGPALESGLFCAPRYSSPALPAPLSEEGPQDYHRWHRMTTPEILSYGPGLFGAPEVPYSPPASPGFFGAPEVPYSPPASPGFFGAQDVPYSPHPSSRYYGMDYAYGDWSAEFYGHVGSCVERINNHGLYGPWPEEFYNVDIFHGPGEPNGQIFGRAPTPPLRPREPEPGVPIFRQHELGNGMFHPCSRWLSTPCEHCGE